MTHQAARRTCQACLIGALLLVWTDPGQAVTHLRRGMKAPPVVVNDLDGNEVTLAGMGGRTVVLIFGELYHTKTVEACRLVQTVLTDKRLAGQKVTVVLIVARNQPPAQLKSEAAGKPVPSTILHDVERKAFGAYRVAVMPSVVVVDGKGAVVHAVAGLTGRFSDIVTDCLLFATGRLGADQFEQALHPDSAADRNPEQVRAERITQLARQLVRRGLDDLAAEKYAEALALSPEHTPARLELGMLLLKRRALADAERQFRAVLSRQPQTVEASLGLAYVQTQRGGDELPEAERIARELLVRSPTEPRAHYLLGLICQKRDLSDQAAASFRKAAELLMERAGSWHAAPGKPTDEPKPDQP